MARTMAANLTGARLRDVDQALRDARGTSAVDAVMKAHPHEARVLQHLFDERRAGRPTPALSRIARVMIWSDGAMEFQLVNSLVTPIGDSTHASSRTTGDSVRRSPGDRGPVRSSEDLGSAGARRGPASIGSGRSSAPADSGYMGASQRGLGVQRPPSGASPGAGAPRLRTAWIGGTRLDPAPRQFRRRPGEDEDVNWSDTPRVGDGWSIVRPGDVLPMDPGDPPDYEAETEATTPTIVDETLKRSATESSAGVDPVTSDGEPPVVAPVAEAETLFASGEVVAVDDELHASHAPVASRGIAQDDTESDADGSGSATPESGHLSTEAVGHANDSGAHA